MAPPLFRIVTIGLLAGGTLSLVVGVGGYRAGNELFGRVATAAGFCSFAAALLVGGGQYAVSGRSFRIYAVPLSVLAASFCLHGVELVRRRWHRTEQLATVVAVVLVLVLPFELHSALHVVAQEWLATQTVAILDLFGTAATIGPTAEGNRTLIRLGNGFQLKIVRECNGIYAGALFSAVGVGARATPWRKVAGVVFALSAVFVINLSRIVFVALAVANDWFGQALTGASAPQVSYYVAELLIGQSVIVASIVAGFLFVGRWIPDVLAFPTAFYESFGIYRR
jgi:archaeosortase A (PGF-CTERM-specific)